MNIDIVIDIDLNLEKLCWSLSRADHGCSCEKEKVQRSTGRTWWCHSDQVLWFLQVSGFGVGATVARTVTLDVRTQTSPSSFLSELMGVSLRLTEWFNSSSPISKGCWAMQSVQWSESQFVPGEISMVTVERWRKHWPFWNKGLRFVVRSTCWWFSSLWSVSTDRSPKV